jgi:hypothetical protein
MEMKTFTQEELKLIIEKHGKWLRSEAGGERADLSSADLRYADLRSADLRYADLRYADLRYADLRYATGNTVNLKTLQTNNWPVSYTDTIMQIGCQRHEIKAWFKFTDEEIECMSGDALEWWKEWKPILKKIIKVSPAAPTLYVEPETKAE